MNLVIAAATAAEISPLLGHLAPYRVSDQPLGYKKGALSIRICVTGVGCTAAAYGLTRCLAAAPALLAIQAGIAGCFSRDIPLGELLRVETDRFGDLGAEDGDRFLDLFALGLEKPDEPPFRAGALPAPALRYPLFRELPSADAVTVSTVSGNTETIRRLADRYQPVLESMEGAAFHYVCLQEQVDFVQLRSVSNYVEVRDTSRWDIPLAVRRLNDMLIRVTETLQNPLP